ncbi:GntR family transcriptional regulator [Gudongella sp. DL1XJH-153]|uniref:GntR family transcriptional regulator n=1 Tax=Gudongella sp. DL1XJH-153 TaxID=3409804 RepID=UPI003BB7A80C
MRILISNSSDEPIYTQIFNQIKAQIIKGELDAGELLPSIRGLAKDLQISVITSKRAYEELEREGFVETIPGKGSYVAPQNKELIREQRLRIIEGSLMDVVREGKLMGLNYEEIEEMLRIMYEEE